MDFVRRPKSKILKILKKFKKIKNGTMMEASSKGPNRISVLLFSLSIHLRTEAEPASETL
jgi:septum formation topological specificity factor MinE